MQIVTVLVTRNRSITVKTLHTVLRMNMACLQANMKNELVFIDDHVLERRDALVSLLKRNDVDRIFWIDYSIAVDDESMKRVLMPFKVGCTGIVFPAVKPGIDWDMFKEKVRKESKEPIYQMGLNFDTEVDKKIEEGLYSVKTTDPRVWVLDAKKAYKDLKDKNAPLKLPLTMAELFGKLKVHAWVNASITITATHECLGNIINSAGIRVEA